MKKMNNKGFAISTMLYGLLILIVLVVSMILSIMAFNRKNSREFSETVVDELEKINCIATNSNENDCYQSLIEAINHSSAGVTTTLLKDLNEDIIVDMAVTANINLNGKKITGLFANNNSNSNIRISNGTLEKEDGKVVYNQGTMTINATINATGEGTKAIENRGNLTIIGGKYTSLSNWTVWNLGTMSISGGTISKTAEDSGIALMNSENGTISGTGGTISSAGYGLVNRSTGHVVLKNMTINGAGTSHAVMADVENTAIYLYNCTVNGTIYAPVQSTIIYTYNTLIYGARNGYILRINRTTSGYYVVAMHGYDSYNVIFPTWTVLNGQDDLKWYTGTKTTDSYSTDMRVSVYSSKHNNETGQYITHVYLDLDGNGSADQYVAGMAWEYK